MRNTTLLLLVASALASWLGALPLIGRPKPPLAWMGWANALAAGTMLGAAYLLLEACSQPLPAALGALLGILFLVLSGRAGGEAALDLNQLEAVGPVFSYQVFLRGSLHAACEGVALGVALALDLRFGLYLSVALAVHNVAEAAVLAAVLRAQGLVLLRAIAVAGVAKAPQAALAVVIYTLVEAAPATLPWMAGFGVGALIHLVLVEPLPAAYHQAGRVSIALVAAAALAAVVLLSGGGAR